MNVDLFAETPAESILTQLLAWHIALEASTRGVVTAAHGDAVRTLIAVHDFQVTNARTRKRS